MSGCTRTRGQIYWPSVAQSSPVALEELRKFTRILKKPKPRSTFCPSALQKSLNPAVLLSESPCAEHRSLVTESMRLHRSLQQKYTSLRSMRQALWCVRSICRLIFIHPSHPFNSTVNTEDTMLMYHHGWKLKQLRGALVYTHTLNIMLCGFTLKTTCSKVILFISYKK